MAKIRNAGWSVSIIGGIRLEPGEEGTLPDETLETLLGKRVVLKRLSLGMLVVTDPGDAELPELKSPSEEDQKVCFNRAQTTRRAALKRSSVAGGWTQESRVDWVRAGRAFFASRAHWKSPWKTQMQAALRTEATKQGMAL